jgi:hypothetical protein
MNRELSLVLLLVVLAGGIFLALQPLLRLYQPLATTNAYSELGLLGPDQNLTFPSSIAVNTPLSLYAYVANHRGSVQLYDVLVKLGNESTIISNSTASDAPVFLSAEHVLSDNQSWILPFSITPDKTATNDRVIVELWSYDSSLSNFTYTGVWSEVWFNVTST